jgi:hypothetical protein
MDNTNTEQAVLPTPPELPKISAKLTGDEMLALFNTYLANADRSLAELGKNADNLAEQLNKVQQMRLVLAGQRTLISDLIAKTTADAVPGATTEGTQTEVYEAPAQ